MNIKRFFAKNSREALSMVRKELGAEAVILSNRTVSGGIEILAFKEEDIEALINDEDTDTKMSPDYLDSLEEDDSFLSFVSKNHRLETSLASSKFEAPEFEAPEAPEAEFNNEAQFMPEPVKRIMAKPSVITSNRAVAHTVTATPSKLNTVQASAQKQLAEKPAPAPVVKAEPAAPVAVSQELSIPELGAKQIASMMGEIRTMRNAIESQLTEMAWNNTQKRDPVKSIMLGTLLSGGYSPALSRQLAESMPANLSQKEGMNWMQAIIEKNLLTMPDENEILDQGGIFTLIGPTGVGKTTTTAKLAARFVMKHGANKLGLITTDAYRIGGHEQLRIYGKILGVMVHAVKDEADLKIALEELKGKHTILIDTVGVSQRDRMVSEQIAMLSSTDKKIKKLLCLNATNTSETLTDVINAYKGKGLDGCIMTKLDEAAIIGNVLDVVIREKLKVYYVANGQRVPEDLHLANKKVLVHRTLKLSKQRNSPFQMRNDELPFLMGATHNMAGAPALAGVDHA